MPSVLDEIPYSEQVANGVSTVFGFTFTILVATDLVVYDNGVVVPSSSYSVSGVGDEGGGAVTFLIAPLNGHLILLSREIALERDTDYQYNGPFREEVVDNDFNRLWQALQGQRAQIGGALRAPYPEQFAELPSPANRANKVLAFDALGAPALSIPTSGTAASLALLLADATLPGNGANLIGYGPTLAYADGTVGGKLNKLVLLTDYVSLVSGGSWHLALAAALAVGSVIVPGDSTFNFSASVTVPSNRMILFTGNATFNWTGAAPGSATGLLTSTTATDIQILGGRFTGGNDVLFAYLGKNVQRVWLDRVRTSGGPQVARFDTTAANYAAVNVDYTSGGFNGNRHVFVSRCHNAGNNRTSGEFNVHMRYSVDSSVDHVTADNVGHNVVWWGGDSNPAVDGALGNERKCKRIRISDCGSTRTVAGVWGSMGDGIVVSNCEADDGTDVLFDPEGSLNVSFNNCHASKGANGNFSTFFYNKSVSFNGGSSRQDTNGAIHFRIYNSSASAGNNDDVIFSNISLRNTVGHGVCDDASGPARSIKFANNELQNVKVSFIGNFNNLQVLGNTLEFTNDTGAAFTAIDTHGGILLDRPAGTALIEGNTVLARYAPFTGSKGVNVTSNDGNGQSLITIKANNIRGFTGAGVNEISITESGANGGISGVFSIEDNKLDAGNYSRTESGALRSKAQLVNNRLASGAPYPSGSAPAGNWDAGQFSSQTAPAAGVPAGWLYSSSAGNFRPMANLA